MINFMSILSKIPKLRFIYFSLIIAIGGVGCWILAFQHFFNSTASSGYNFCANLGTFSISLAVMSFVDHLVITKSRFDLTDALFSLLIALVSVGLGVLPLFSLGLISVFGSWASLTLAAIVWWIVQMGNEALDEPNAYSTLGGEV